ncbi:MAG: ribbon-helix-helix protein, CopG family [Desulfurococcales archaeon]|nr:ribbon-helix-helix protein, CopG family [Desulfurococcales archaeon]MEB3779920.1 ribbon-helix-helix protein, CopG family [Desulfurococcales archaeon]
MSGGRSAYRIVTFKIDPRMLTLMDKTALMLHKTRSELIREAIRLYLRTLMAEQILGSTGSRSSAREKQN